MCKECEANAAQLNPEELDTVSGGCRGQGDCYFMPEKPTNSKKEGEYLLVKCESRCTDLFNLVCDCSCFNTPLCVDRYHRMTEDSRGGWAPYPENQNNHGAPGKRVLL